jgi:hypothetical protein
LGIVGSDQGGSSGRLTNILALGKRQRSFHRLANHSSMNWRTSFRLSLLAALSCMMTGCVTSALWEEGRFARFHEPAAPPKLRLFESSQRQDILVQYDEWSDMNEKLKTRSYWLGQDLDSTSNPHKPAFVSASAGIGLQPIQIYEASAFLAQTNVGLAAVTSWNPPGFTLYSGEKVLGSHVLPVYEDGSATTKKVLLTPLAVTADAAIITGYLYLLYAHGCAGGDYD